MIKKIFSLLFVISLLGYSSCTKETTSEPPATIDNHIKFKANQEEVNAKFKVLLQDPIYNAYYPKDGEIVLRRLVEDGSTQGMAFKIERLDLETTPLPITVSYTNDFNTPTVTAIYTDVNNTSFGSSSNPAHFSITVNSYSENVINCTFSGKLFTLSTPTEEISISDGDLNLELIEY